MSKEQNQQDPEEKEKVLSPEEYAKMRKNMIDYYKEQLAFLKPQKEYETLLADIEEARARRMAMGIRMAQMASGPEKEPDQNDQPTSRKLKTN